MFTVLSASETRSRIAAVTDSDRGPERDPPACRQLADDKGRYREPIRCLRQLLYYGNLIVSHFNRIVFSECATLSYGNGLYSVIRVLAIAT